ncbi:SHPS1 phosphatase, partial [Galbula dea]|nr:SHPS1 phosphatase [Galbula dea]
ESFQMQQPQDRVSVTAGETITLTCTVFAGDPPGPVKWLKGWGTENQTVYEQTSSFPRVTRVTTGSNTDFSIQIRDAQPEDAGTYYCAKFLKRRLELFTHGRGTVVSVQAKPTHPVVSGPDHRGSPGQLVTFTCTAGGFFPKNISVKWFKDMAQVSSQPPQISPEHTKSYYNMSSTVTMMLQKDDVRSQLVCEVQHPTLMAPLRGTYQLRESLRVSPSVRVVTDPASSIEVNKTVNISCHVEGFYPGDVAVTWLENRAEIKAENNARPEETQQGLFKLRSLLEVQATEQRNGSVFSCRAVHDGQDPVSGIFTLWISVPAK